MAEMNWKQAIYASPVLAATRPLGDGIDYDGTEPNIILFDSKHQPPLPKAFRAVERYAWQRRPLGAAKNYEDWDPAQTRDTPLA